MYGSAGIVKGDASTNASNSIAMPFFFSPAVRKRLVWFEVSWVIVVNSLWKCMNLLVL